MTDPEGILHILNTCSNIQFISLDENIVISNVLTRAVVKKEGNFASVLFMLDFLEEIPPEEERKRASGWVKGLIRYGDAIGLYEIANEIYYATFNPDGYEEYTDPDIPKEWLEDVERNFEDYLLEEYNTVIELGIIGRRYKTYVWFCFE